MEPSEKKEEKPAAKLPETPQLPKRESDLPNPKTAIDHNITSEKDLNLTYEDRALDSGI